MLQSCRHIAQHIRLAAKLDETNMDACQILVYREDQCLRV